MLAHPLPFASGLALLAEQDRAAEHFFVLGASDPGVGIYLPLELYRRDTPFPRSWHALSMAPHDLLLSRPDAETLQLTVVGGELLATHGETLGRHPRYPLQVGDEVAIGVATVRVDAMGEHGPTRFSLRFAEPLEQTSTLLLTWEDDTLRVVEPPPVGETVTLPWSPGPLAF